jgi:putative NADPH-quinone reductase
MSDASPRFFPVITSEGPMRKHILIIDGHPDSDPARFCHAIAGAYAEAAVAAGHNVSRIDVSQLDFPILRTRADWEQGTPIPAVRACQQALASAHHLVLIHPLWLGDVPALLKAFLEQLFRPGFAIKQGARTLAPGLLKGKSARIVVTMGMPAVIYRLFFFAHSVSSLRRNILRFVGFGPIRQSLIGNVEGSADARARWLDRIRACARAGE